MGSKRRFAKDILKIVLRGRTDGQWYVEPFVGGANVIDKVKGNRIGSDNHPYLIAFLKALSNGYIPPKFISEEEYNDIKNNKEKYSPELVGYVGFNLTFGSKWFGGFRRDKENRDYSIESFRSVLKQSLFLKDVIFICSDYLELDVPKNSIIYCDPPYDKTTSYNKSFVSNVFWDWCREKQKEGNMVFISEYNAPDDFVYVWGRKVNIGLTEKRKQYKKEIEKLFVHESMNYKKIGLVY
jgi:DNA adenine methylase